MTRIRKEDSSQHHSPQSLENSISRIEQLLVPARRVAAEMARLEIGDLFIGNQPSFHCSLLDLSRWGKACEDAFTDKLKEIGYFGAGKEAAPPPPHPRRKTVKAKKARKG